MDIPRKRRRKPREAHKNYSTYEIKPPYVPTSGYSSTCCVCSFSLPDHVRRTLKSKAVWAKCLRNGHSRGNRGAYRGTHGVLVRPGAANLRPWWGRTQSPAKCEVRARKVRTSTKKLAESPMQAPAATCTTSGVSSWILTHNLLCLNCNSRKPQAGTRMHQVLQLNVLKL